VCPGERRHGIPQLLWYPPIKSVNFDENFGGKFLEGNFAEKFGKKEISSYGDGNYFLGVETLVRHVVNYSILTFRRKKALDTN
jgi:hypothetical protein